MKQLAKVAIGVAALCILLAFVVKAKVSGAGIIDLGPMMWLKLAGLSLLFSIAASLLPKEK